MSLQGHHVVLQDIDDFLLRSFKRPDHLFLQQRDAFAQRRQRGLQFVRNMAQGALAFGFEFAQTTPQPVQAAPDSPQIGGSANRHRLVEAALAQAFYRSLQTD